MGALCEYSKTSESKLIDTNMLLREGKDCCVCDKLYPCQNCRCSVGTQRGRGSMKKKNSLQLTRVRSRHDCAAANSNADRLSAPCFTARPRAGVLGLPMILFATSSGISNHVFVSMLPARALQKRALLASQSFTAKLQPSLHRYQRREPVVPIKTCGQVSLNTSRSSAIGPSHTRPDRDQAAPGRLQSPKSRLRAVRAPSSDDNKPVATRGTVSR